MATGGVNQSDIGLDCSICLSSFRNPKLLPCFHTFCVQCLDEYVTRTGQNGSFECPLCRASTCVPEGGVNSFQSNFYIQSEELFQADTDCDVCDKGLICSHYCLDCEEHFCQNCGNAHTKMKMSREHKVMVIKDSKEGGFTRKVQKKSYCPHHSGEEIKMICKDCKVLLCVVCKLSDHENHTSSGIGKEASEMRLILSEKIKRTKEENEFLKSHSMEKIKHQKDGIKMKLESDLNAVDTHIGTVIEKIRNEGDKVKQKLADKGQDILDCLSQKQKLLEGTVKEREAVMTYAQNIVEIGDDFQVLDLNFMMRLESIEVSQDNSEMRNCSLGTYVAPKSYSVSEIIGKIVKSEGYLAVDSQQSLNCSIIGGTLQANSMLLSPRMLYAGFLDFNKLLYYNTTTGNNDTINHQLPKNGSCSGMAIAGDTCFFSCLPDKTIYKLRISKKHKAVLTVDKYPHGIACNRNNELLICILESSKSIEMGASLGCIKAFPLSDDKKEYIWRKEETPGPTCIACNKTDGTVCLGYPAAGKVTLNSANGYLLLSFTDIKCYGSPEQFCPVSVCFDKDGGIFIADYGNGAVIRMDEYMSSQKCLVKEKQPLCVVVGGDNELYVGFMDRYITRYKLNVKK